MNKRILLLPLLSGLVLTGCDFFKKDSGKKDPINNVVVDPPKDIPLMEEYGDYKMASSVVAGREYLLGSKRTQGLHDGEVRFFNGNYHIGDDEEDEKSYNKRYSHYLGTTKAENNDLSFAARLEAVDAGNGEFSFIVHTTDESLPWNNKYLGVYPSKATKNYVLSFCLLDTPDSKTFISVDDNKYASSDGELEVTSNTVFSKFKFYTTYQDERPIKTIGFEYLYDDAGDTEEVAKFFGTEGDYSSFN